MNREIKFRAWDTQNKKMLSYEDEWYDRENMGKQIVQAKMYVPCYAEENKVIEITYLSNLSKYNFSAEEINAIPMQYTGLKDRNGVEIYEGDIISNKEGNIFNVQVEFLDGAFTVEGMSFGENENEHSTYIKNWKVVGNIHENPELLTEKSHD